MSPLPDRAGECCHLSVAQLAAMRKHGRVPSQAGSSAPRVRSGPGGPELDLCPRCVERLAVNKAEAGTQLTLYAG